jgi:hypothetical protein
MRQGLGQAMGQRSLWRARMQRHRWRRALLQGGFRGRGRGLRSMGRIPRTSFAFGAAIYVSASPWAVVAIDRTGDGRLDLVTTNFFDNSISILTGRWGGSQPNRNHCG